MGLDYEVVDENYVFKPHDSEKCPNKCQFVANIDCIFISKEVQNQAKSVARVNSPWEALLASLNLMSDPVVRLDGFYTLPGWSGCLQFYAFLCMECDQVGVSYIRGYNIHMTCNHCNASFSLRDKKYYRESGLEPPPLFWELLKDVRQSKKDSTSLTLD